MNKHAQTGGQSTVMNVLKSRDLLKNLDFMTIFDKIDRNFS
jgi:hypothetical protein